MSNMRPRHNEDRLFVRDGRKSYRRSYSFNEFRIGMAVLLALACVLAWVAWKGAHPDPDLLSSDADLLIKGGTIAVEGSAPLGTSGSGQSNSSPLPSNLALPGWTVGNMSQFGWDNLYVKINGREDYYKSFGFERLYFVSILMDENQGTAVDIELYDLGSAANALGAYAGERSPGTRPDVTESGMGHLDRNALFLTRGAYYLRAIGSDESPEVLAELAHLRPLLENSLTGEPLPWGYALFVGSMGFDPGAVAYAPENAFSFGFANHVYSATLDDGDTEVFVVATRDGAGAEALAEQFHEGFMSYGTEAGTSGGIEWVKDRYVGTISGAGANGPWTIGVHAAPDLESAVEAYGSIRQAVGSLDPAIADLVPEAGTGEGESEAADAPTEEGGY